VVADSGPVRTKDIIEASKSGELLYLVKGGVEGGMGSASAN
jgi:hypothetical protein